MSTRPRPWRALTVLFVNALLWLLVWRALYVIKGYCR